MKLILFFTLLSLFNSNNGAIKEVKKGAQRLAQVILGASHLAQVAIPAVLAPSSEADRVAIVAWKDNLNSTIEKQAKLLCDLLNECYGLDVIYPQGAMYAMARIQVDMFTDAIRDDVTFMKILLEEENIVVLPGRAFGLSDTFDIKPSCYVFRVVFCAPENILRDAAERICLFCHRHSKK